MKSIWLTGPSGTGKSTFAKLLSKEFDIPIRKEVTRANTTILNSNFATRQLFFSLQYVNRHKASAKDQFISDRTILDYIFWTIYDKESSFDRYVQYHDILKELFWLDELTSTMGNPGSFDIFVLVPMPDLDTFESKIFPNFLSDQLRYSIYMGKHHDVYGYSPYTQKEFMNFLFGMSANMASCIKWSFDQQISPGIVLKPNPIVHNKYWDWQDEAFKQIKRILR